MSAKKVSPSHDTAPRFFESAEQFRDWLSTHHATAPSLVVGFYRAAAGRPTMTWTESVRTALCFGWIDGLVQKLDDERYTRRFTPRTATSIWSAVNIKHAESLIAEGLMQPAGLRAFEARDAERSAIYSFEQREVALPEPYMSTLAADAKANAYWDTLPASYRKAVSWWVSSAKQVPTRDRRFQQLLDACHARK
ncbi:MAG: YdeI/OmpD-associated family protein, partial [Gemmatimonadaceae bacterium]|nr:YdeI/OmpD-associated family protein [Gemmatimonadaceae bacterium]